MIKHIKCDIFESGADVILHQVNCQGVMGSGVARQVKDKYPHVFRYYKMVCNSAETKKRLLGTALMVEIEDGNHYIGNLFAQENFGYDGKCYTDYEALKESLRRSISTVDLNHKPIIAIPYLMGCHRGGGDWNIVYKMIEEIFQDYDVLICEYDGG